MPRNLPPHAHVAALVRAEMARHNVQQHQLVPLLGVSQAGVSRRMLGMTPLKANELLAIADLLDVPAETLGVTVCSVCGQARMLPVEEEAA